MSLSTLPLLPLEAVASHLDFSSLVSLANTNTAFAHLQPTEQFLTGQDFSLSGPRDGDFCPETYFEVEVVSRGLVAIKMDWEWRDQVNMYYSKHFLFLFNLSGPWQSKRSTLAAAGEGWSGNVF